MKREHMLFKLRQIDSDIKQNQEVIRSYIKAGEFFTTGRRMVRHENLTLLARMWEAELAL